MQLAAAILAEVVPRRSVLLRVLEWDQLVERSYDFVAGLLQAVQGHHEDEVIAPDVSNEPGLTTAPLHHVVQNLGQDADDAVAVMITVPVVVFLEMIQVGVADGERLGEVESIRPLPALRLS